MKDIADTTPSASAVDCKHVISLRDTGETYLCDSRETLLQGMARIGRKCIPTGCLNGGCGVCKVAIEAGNVRKVGAMSRTHVSEQEESQGVVLACRVAPMGPVELKVVGKMKKNFSCTPWQEITS